MKQVKLLFIIALLSTVTASLWGQTVNLATWTFSNASGDWGSSPRVATSSNSNVTVVGLTRGSGITLQGTAAGSAWGGTGFNDGLSTQTAATAIAQSNFVTFSVTANTGFTLSMTSISPYNVRRSASGPVSMQWQFSINGTDFTSIGNAITIGTTTTAAGNLQAAVDLSGIAALQNLPAGTTVTLRALMWGANGDTGTWYFNSANAANPSLLINGVVVVSAPLSLNLISFKGNSENSINKLNWITVNEKDLDNFELERSSDGRDFYKIAVSKAKGNHYTSDNYYSYNDAHAGANAYYRLKIVDINGNADYSNILVLHKDGSKPAIHIYPNPASSILYLEGMAKSFSYNITDAVGRTVMQANAIEGENSVVSINIANLVHGVYFLQLSDENGNQSIRVIKK